jgi:hypothetical protein
LAWSLLSDGALAQDVAKKKLLLITESKGFVHSVVNRGKKDMCHVEKTFVEIAISAETADHAAWRQPVHAYFRRTADGWKLVGLERLPEKLPEAGATAR